MRSLTKYPESIPYQHERLKAQHDKAEFDLEQSKPKGHKSYIKRRQTALAKVKAGK
jgi:hypothetical protein